MRYPDVAADLINSLLYGGKRARTCGDDNRHGRCGGKEPAPDAAKGL